MISSRTADIVCMTLAFAGPIYWVFRLRILMLGVLLGTATFYFSFLLAFALLHALDAERDSHIPDMLFLVIGWLPASIYAFLLAGIRLLVERFRRARSRPKSDAFSSNIRNA